MILNDMRRGTLSVVRKRRVVWFGAGALFLLVGMGILYSRFACEVLVLTPNGHMLDRRSGFYDPKGALVLVSTDILSYEESKRLVLEEPSKSGLDRVIMCRHRLFGFPKDEQINAIIAIGDRWNETMGLTQAPVIVFAIGPHNLPPTDYPSQHMAVVLGVGARYEKINPAWKIWCRNHNVPFTELRDFSSEALRNAMIEVGRRHSGQPRTSVFRNNNGY